MVGYKTFFVAFSSLLFSGFLFASDAGYAEIKKDIMSRNDPYAVKMQKQIAFNYEVGANGFSLDKKSALKWYLLAFNNGDSYSGYKYSVLSKDIGNVEDFILFSRKSIEKNNKNACFSLANYYIDEYKKDLFLNKKYIYSAKDVLTNCGLGDPEAERKIKDVDNEIKIIEKR